MIFLTQFSLAITSHITKALNLKTDHIKLSGATDMLRGRDAIQRDLDRLVKWAHKNLMEFKAKCKGLNMIESSLYQYRLSDELLSSRSAEDDWRLEEKLDMRWQCLLAAQEANCMLGFVKRSIASRLREVILCLL
ncbi:rna-directed dna polymerase from mobile element jockey-like [Willisornis vidua]|uniref:Rna-directed dna polymerase from mobile element jockey-like n=1 Tax=Willisornis vidua TaxID=1566151 RepID=A0ABQ9D0Z5_9PASS|nr:rna-directed dna polymerase from mobile element jockey-like [Willisornis vidua]